MLLIANLELIAVICGGLAIRAIVSLNSYSGAGKPPMHGDYEAQRHWQEITLNLNINEWYKNGTQNDLMYWGLDYPPLTAYHSHIMGRVAKAIDPTFVELHKSRRYESARHKTFMRLTVLLADLVIYIPGIYTLCQSVATKLKTQDMLPFCLLLMLFPGQILIDNGHFQYNNISLGLTAFAIAAILRDKHMVASFFFSLALNYKQMELYHSLPFFAFLLSNCLIQKRLKLMNFLSLAIAVLTTFILIWFPWIWSLDEFSAVLHRLFPFGRGIFEDKVSNFWCALNVVVKLKKLFTNHQMAVMCLGATAAAIIPINIGLFMKPNKDNFLLALFNTSLAFFLFSFQVHEKSILLVALPACCLFYWNPIHTFWFLQVATFSMFPLLERDNLVLPFFALMTAYHLIFYNIYFKLLDTTSSFREANWKKLYVISLKISTCVSIFCTIAYLLIPPPKRYPDLWALLICVVSCAQFTLSLMFVSFVQFIGKYSDKTSARSVKIN